MPDLNAWLSRYPSDIPVSTKAELTWRRINQEPTVIRIRRKGATLAPQTVRVEQNLRVREDLKTNSNLGVTITVVFGLRDHPTLPDTDIKPRDRFLYENSEFEVVTVIVHEGEVQAICEARFG